MAEQKRDYTDQFHEALKKVGTNNKNITELRKDFEENKLF